MNKLLILLTILALLFFPHVLVAMDEPIIFPKEGQSKEQLAQDKTYCKTWAEEETGIDPDVIALKRENIEEKVTTDDESKFGGLLKGVFKGAATGAATGAIDANIDNEVGGGALKGAVLGGVFKHEKQKDRKDELGYRKDSFEREDLKEQLDRYRRAYAVCLEAKGYTVK